jgi:hypothetical protein
MQHTYKLQRQREMGLRIPMTSEAYLFKLWKAIKEIYYEYANQLRNSANLPEKKEQCLDDAEIEILAQEKYNVQNIELVNQMNEKLREALRLIKEKIPTEVINAAYDDGTKLFETDQDIPIIMEELMTLFLNEVPPLAIKYWKEKIELLHNMEKESVGDSQLSKAGFIIVQGLDNSDPSIVTYLNSHDELAKALLTFPPFIAACLDDKQYLLEEFFINLLDRHVNDKEVRPFFMANNDITERVHDLIRNDGFSDEFKNANKLIEEVYQEQRKRM